MFDVFNFFMKKILKYSLAMCLVITSYSCDDETCFEQIWYEDADSDGFGNPSVFIEECEQPVGFVGNSDDKDDTLPCRDSKVWFEDKDEDGFGNPDVSVKACEQPVGFVDNSDDENDTLPCQNPKIWFEDMDEDGLGNSDVSVEACEQPVGFVDNDDDDDDTNNCNLNVWYKDNDGDGLGNLNVQEVGCEKPLGFVNNADDDDDSFGLNNNEVEIHNQALADEGYVLLNELGSDKVRLISKDGTTRSVWDLGEGNGGLGNDAELLKDGILLSALKVNPPPLSQGGYGGKIEIRNSDKKLTWEYEMSSLDALQHHDVEMLPNGNVLVMVWSQKKQEEILSKGYIGTATTLNTESIYEINPINDEIVWEWHAWDHLIQDKDSSKDGFGVLIDNPQKINLNYITDTPGFMHANGIDYDSERDIIFISIRSYSEIWVIDHNTTTAEAKGSKGDLLYRFGNPETYNSSGKGFSIGNISLIY